MIVGHGFCSSCLFYALYVFYKRFFTRSVFFGKGLLQIFPLFGVLWFIFLVLNMGVPPFFPFFSEILLVISLLSYWFGLFFLLFVVLLFSGIYGIYLYVFLTHGRGVHESFSFNIFVREYLVFYGHFFPLVYLVILLFVFC